MAPCSSVGPEAASAGRSAASWRRRRPPPSTTGVRSTPSFLAPLSSSILHSSGPVRLLVVAAPGNLPHVLAVAGHREHLHLARARRRDHEVAAVGGERGAFVGTFAGAEHM